MTHICKILAATATTAILLIGSGVSADSTRFENGGDTFVAGDVISEDLNTSGDAFATARTVTARGEAGGDLHVTGFDVTIDANTSEDLYAMGATVIVHGDVAEDLTAIGFSVRTDAGSTTTGNARLVGRTVTIDGPITGALSAVGQDIVLNTAVKGDVRITAQSITFGPDAVVSGTFTYSTTDEITVPDRVAPASRVSFERATPDEIWEEWEQIGADLPSMPSFASLMFGFLVSLLFFVVLGAVMLGFLPKRLEAMRKTIASAPGLSMLLGVVGLSMLFGMVPITGLTIIGLPFVPIVLLAIVVAWILGYALGTYSVAMRIWAAFGSDVNPSNVTRLLVFAAALILIALLNYIPFVGWVVNYSLVLLGIGAMTNAIFQYLVGNPGAALDIDMKPIED